MPEPPEVPTFAPSGTQRLAPGLGSSLLRAPSVLPSTSCIPLWDSVLYSGFMTTQIAVRLPDEVVAFLDHEIQDGGAGSRAEIVTRALEREWRLRRAERDAEILRSCGPEDDLDEAVAWSNEHFALAD